MSKPVGEIDAQNRGHEHRVYDQRKKGIISSYRKKSCDQTRAIGKNLWLAEVELDAIKIPGFENNCRKIDKHTFFVKKI